MGERRRVYYAKPGVIDRRGFWPEGKLPPANGHRFGLPPYQNDPKLPCRDCGRSWWDHREDPQPCLTAIEQTG